MQLTRDQQEVFDSLIDLWRGLEPGGSRLVVVQGGPGVGKTAVVHALYSYLVARAAEAVSADELFWGPEIGWRKSGEQDPAEQAIRKLVTPIEPNQPDGDLVFGWFGHSCRSSDGTAATSELEEQLVSETFVQSLHLERTESEWQTKEEAAIALLTFLAVAGPELLGLGVLGRVIEWGLFSDAFRRWLRSIRIAEQFRTELSMDIGLFPWKPFAMRRRARQVCSRFERFAELGMPSVLAIEDAHLADEGTIDLCGELLASGASRVLIVATANSEPLLAQMDTGECFGRLLTWRSDGENIPLQIHRVDTTSEDIERIVEEVLGPNFQRGISERIVALGDGNLQATNLLASRARVGLALPKENEPSKAIDVVLAQRWLELPDALRVYLAAIASLHRPVWFDQPIDGLSNLPREIQEEGRSIGVRIGAIVQIDAWRLAFIDSSLFSYARHSATDLFPLSELRSAKRDLFESIRADKGDADFWSRLPLEVRSTILLTETALYEEASPDDRSEWQSEAADSYSVLAGIQAVSDEPAKSIISASRAADLIALIRRTGGIVSAQQEIQVLARYQYLPLAGHSFATIINEAWNFATQLKGNVEDETYVSEYLPALWNVASLHAEVNDFHTALVILSDVLDTADDRAAEDQLHAWRHDSARWEASSGRAVDAVEKYSQLLPDCRRMFGTSSLHSMEVRNLIASARSDAGHVAVALDEFGALAADCNRIFGPDHPQTLAVRGNMASSLGKSGHVGEAIAELRSVLADEERILGPENRHTLAARNNLAHWLSESGQLSEAIAELRTVLADQQNVLGPDHLHTFTARKSLAAALGESGQATAAIAGLRSVLADEQRVLGPDNPHTLTTRNNLAIWLGRSGQLIEALTELRSVLADRTRVLGPDHPQTLTTRNNLAIGLGESGQVTEAIGELRTLLTDEERVLGPDHPQTFTMRNNLAHLLSESGQLTLAMAELRSVRADEERVLGRDHPQTLTTRRNLAIAIGTSGQMTLAIVEFRSVLADEERVLGRDHPETLTTRRHLAMALGKSGQVTEAIAELRSLLADEERVLGPDDPDTLDTRNSLAIRRGEAGQVTEAIAELRALLVDQDRVLGPDHPRNFTTRNNLANWLGRSGQLAEAIDEFRTVLACQERVLSPDHPHALTTRNNLAMALGTSGQVTQAIAELRSVLVDAERALGPDHPVTLATRSNLQHWLDC